MAAILPASAGGWWAAAGTFLQERQEEPGFTFKHSFGKVDKKVKRHKFPNLKLTLQDQIQQENRRCLTKVIFVSLATLLCSH